jgi:pimeloyl-ACP methyl ester carboxylesterase
VGSDRRALAALLALPVLTGCEKLAYFPVQLQEGHAQAVAARHASVAEELRIVAAEGVTLHGWLARSPGMGPRPLVVYFGGNAEEVSWMLDHREAFSGWDLALVNYRGYGRSGGQPSEQALLSDAVTLYDDLVQRPDVDRAHIVAMGRSLGSGVATHLASRRPLAGVILVSPFDTMTAVAEEAFPFLPARWILGTLYDSAKIAPGLSLPLQMIVADRDEVISAERSKRLYQAWGGPKRKVAVPGAGHNDIHLHPAYWEAVSGFLAARAPTAAR